MRTLKRTLTVGLTVALIAIGLTAAPALAGPAGSFVSKINAERTARGLAPLQVYWDLTDDAKAHSTRMMNQDNLHHNPNLAGVTTGWEALGENVGVGPSVNSLHDAFMASSPHKKNILGNFNYVGVGVVIESDSKMWVTVVFMRGPADLLDPPPADDPPPSEDPPPPEDPPPADDPAPVGKPKPKATKTAAAKASAPKADPDPEPEPMFRVRSPHQAMVV